jgi:hypothetical protein
MRFVGYFTTLANIEVVSTPTFSMPRRVVMLAKPVVQRQLTFLSLCGLHEDSEVVEVDWLESKV